MMLKFVVMLLMVLSVACSHVEKQKDIDQNKAVQPVKTIEEPVNKPKPVDLEPEEKSVEPSQLDADLLFSLLSGEVAGQRGNIRMASAFYLDAAKRSGDAEVALRAAQIALYNKDLVSAKSAVDILVEEGDLQLSSHRLALTIYLHAAEVEKSLNQVDFILKKSDVSLRNTVLSIGDLVARNASKEVATRVMNDLVARFPEKASVYLARSRVMSHFAELEQAKKDAVKTTKVDSSWPAGFAQLALVLDGQGEIDQALLVLKQAAERLEVRQLVMVYGRLLAKNEHYEAAKKQFLRLLSDG
ncbi:MAG: tetratricopeptide repeat protein, partial [Cycloclasticus sp.]